MKQSRILAVEHVNLEAPPGLNEDLTWFYAEVAGLDPVGDVGVDAPRLRFKSAQIEVRIHIKNDPRIDPVVCRATILVRCLSETNEQFDERKIACVPLCGLAFMDRRIAVLDPAGNRVELKQEWPEIAL